MSPCRVVVRAGQDTHVLLSAFSPRLPLHSPETGRHKFYISSPSNLKCPVPRRVNFIHLLELTQYTSKYQITSLTVQFCDATNDVRLVQPHTTTHSYSGSNHAANKCVPFPKTWSSVRGSGVRSAPPAGRAPPPPETSPRTPLRCCPLPSLPASAGRVPTTARSPPPLSCRPAPAVRRRTARHGLLHGVPCLSGHVTASQSNSSMKCAGSHGSRSPGPERARARPARRSAAATQRQAPAMRGRRLLATPMLRSESCCF